MVAYTKHDLRFILDGIEVSESHAQQTNSIDINNTWSQADIEVSRQTLLALVPNALEPIGMRTISGELNNLVEGNEYFGATGEFPRLLDADYPTVMVDPDGDGPAPAVPMSYDPTVQNPGQNGPAPLGDVLDPEPRTISNLIVDQTINNPVALNAALALAGVEDVTTAIPEVTLAFRNLEAALENGDQAGIDAATAAYNTTLEAWGIEADEDGLLTILNTAPDEGLSAPFNSWMTLFGQFFDHGLDLVAKGGNGTVFVPLQEDDPLFNPNSPTNFMVLTRSTLNENGEALNLTSPFVDQNQTYTSHPSHQIWIREYEFEDRNNDGKAEPFTTGGLIEGASGGMATWGEVKAQALEMGFVLTDIDGLNIPEFAVDQYGDFLAGPNGFPQIVLDDRTVVEGDPDNPISVSPLGEVTDSLGNVLGQAAPRTGFSFLLDIAHNANPVDSQGQPRARYEDGDANDGIDATNDADGTNDDAYDGDLLDAHYIAGDGRANENFGLTAVHHVFHQEHNRLVEHTKSVLLSTENMIDLATVDDPTGEIAALELLNGFLVEPVTAIPTTQTEIDALVWDGDRLFQASKFGTEMQYQHLVFEEFGRKVQPAIDIFASYEPGIDASIVAEFAHTVYRFGHSMLTETVDLMDEQGNLTEVGLIEAFLNPVGFNARVNADGTVLDADVLTQSSAEAAGAIVRGMTRQQGSEIDEYVTEALRNNLLGLPLDLATLNLARGRETGVPSLNDARAQWFEETGDTKLKPYDSWLDFALHTKHGGASIVNFIAAYGTHDAILAEDTLAGKRAAAMAITLGQDQDILDENGAVIGTVTVPEDRLDFLNATGAYSEIVDPGLGGLNVVDFWIGGLAEAIEPFGGMLGSSFNFVFEQQMEDLQDGDRFYYLARTAGLNFITQLEQNSFANMIIRNTDIGDNGADHLPGDIFSTPAYILEVDQSRQINYADAEPLTEIVEVAVGQSGMLETPPQTGPDDWFSVTFDNGQIIPNAVVVVMVNTENGGAAVTARVRNVTDTGFEYQIDEWDRADGAHPSETISWVAMQAGRHVLPDGTVIQAGNVTAENETVENVQLVDFTDAPVVLSQVSTANDPSAVTTRMANVTNTGFDVRLQEEEAASSRGPGGGVHGAETVGYIAIQAAPGSSVTTGLTGDNVTHQQTNLSFPTAFAAVPAFFAQMQTLDGADTAAVRGRTIDANGASFFIEEDVSLDNETNHTTENVGYVALPTGVITANVEQEIPGSLDLTRDPTNDPVNPGAQNPFLDLGPDANPLVIRGDLDNDGDNDLLQYTGGDHVVLGGTEEDDVLIGGIGDDTLWGDGGNDRLEGGDGGDILLGGAGDDIITDVGGLDNIQGQDGNDAISSGAGEDLILAGAGKDFVLMGTDLSETFGGQGDDFISAGKESNIVFGGEGNDWLEGEEGNNLLQGDNGDPFLNSTVTGHDVFIPGQGDDDYDAESGDDIMLGGIGIQRFEGLNGFDWASYARDPNGVEADFFLRAFDETPIPPGPENIMDRFDQTEGLSGSASTDILRGGDADAVTNATQNNGGDNVLRNFDLIWGLREGDFGGNFDATALFTADTTEWGAGDIILGGDGSDLIEGRGGDDIIDGDLWLNVRLLIRDPDTGAPIASADGMYGQLYAVNELGQQIDENGAVVTGNMLLDPDPRQTTDIGGHPNLQAAVFAGLVNPGNIHIVREILNDDNGGDFDTAVFSGVRSEYVIENTNGVIGDDNGDGFISVSHVAGALTDGTDLLRNIERLSFADQQITLSGNNAAPTGAPLILDADTNQPLSGNPTVGQQLTATAGDIADADTIDSPISFIWQIEQDAGTGDFTDILIINGAGEEGPLQGATIEVPPDSEGLALRVRASFVDGQGVIESVFSAPTALTAAAADPVPTTGDDLLIGTLGNDTIDALAGDDQVFGLDGADTLIGGPGSDILDGGPGGDTLRGNQGQDELIGGGGQDNLFGGGGADLLSGGAGADTLNGNGGADELFGDGGDDTLDGGGGSDFINGGGGNDTAVFNTLSTNATFTFAPNGNLEVGFGNQTDELINVELLQFNDQTITFQQAQQLVAGVTFLATGQTTFNGANGVDEIVIGNDVAETINGGNGDDILFGEGGADIINGNGGDDGLIGGAQSDTLNGGGGADLLIGNGGADTLNGDGGTDTIEGGNGNDVIDGGGGADLIIWNVDDDHDVVDGGAGADTFEVNGNGLGETYRIYATADTNVVLPTAIASALIGTPEIVITRDDGTGEEIIAELTDIQEIVLNTDAIAASVEGAVDIRGDNVVIIGDFSTTTLATNTITITGSEHDDTIDMTQLTSEHRVVFNTEGGNDHIEGGGRPQDVVNLDPGAGYVETDNGDGTTTTSNGQNSVTFESGGQFTFNGMGTSDGFIYSALDLINLKKLVNGIPLGNEDDDALFTGTRDLEGTGNNQANPDYGSADQPFIRLTTARYGDEIVDGDNTVINREINPIWNGLDPRDISNKIGFQEPEVGKNEAGANLFFMAFGQYFDHGLDFLPKSDAYGKIAIGGLDVGFDPNNPADLTRGAVAGFDQDGNPFHTNKTSPFVDQNQAYGSTELVGQFLREGDDNGGLTARLLAGGVDPSNPEFNLLPTLREALEHHWANNTLFKHPSLDGGEVRFQDYYPDLFNTDGTFNTAVLDDLNNDFMGSGHTLIGDKNGFINILEHYVAGDLRANENYTLTAMHTVWARNHNYHVDKLEAAGFQGTEDEIFEAAKIVNEAEYQRVVFDEFADYLLGGMKGSGSHGHDDYDPTVDARISHEFAAAVYRVGHSLIGENVTVLDANGQAVEVPLFDAFLNPTNEEDAFNYTSFVDHQTYYGAEALAKMEEETGYTPQPGFQQIGVSNVLGGIVQQQAEEVDYNLVEAVRSDLVRIRADLFGFNVARAWDVGLGTLNQVKMDLAKSDNPYIKEAIELSGEDMTPYATWEDFQLRNGLSDEVLQQFKDAYPDLMLAAEEIEAFSAINPDINVEILESGNGLVKGIDRVDLWVGGLAEQHINGGMVGVTFWVVLHEQFDRLQQGDRFYYLDRVGDFDFYDSLGDFSEIVARTTGLEGLPSDIFRAEELDTADDTANGADDGESDNGESDGPAVADVTPRELEGDEGANTLMGAGGNDLLAGLGENDSLVGGSGGDTLLGGEGDDNLIGNDGDDTILGGDGADRVLAGSGDDMVFGDEGDDRVFGEEGNDVIDGGAGDDHLDGGEDNDTFIADVGDGNDTIFGGDGIDTYDLSRVDQSVEIDLGGAFGSAESDQIGLDQLASIENVIGGRGADTIVAGSGANVMAGGAGDDTFVFKTAAEADGDIIADFQAGDTIDVSGIAASFGLAGGEFTLTADPTMDSAGNIVFRHEQDSNGNEYTILEGHGDDDGNADFSITLLNRHDLKVSDFNGVG